VKNANPVSSASRWFMMVLLLASLSACGGDAPAAANVKPASEYFSIRVGSATVQLQLAVTDSEMERGLMGRTNLRSNQGMLFIYPEPRQVSFWMRNTPTPLEIGYFTSDGTLREVYPLLPFDERSVPSRRADIQYAMEVCAGWFDATGVKPGDKIDLKAVAAAMKERGFSLRDYRGLR
jgi:uncharacterized protein